MEKRRQRVNWQQKQGHLLQEIEGTQRMASHLPKGDIYKELEILKVRVHTAKLDTKRYRNYLRSEWGTLSAIRQELDSQLQRRRKRSMVLFFFSALPTVLIYIGMYFSLIPGNYYAVNPALYLAVCGLMLCAWVGWFFLMMWLYRRVLEHFVFPFTFKYPSLARSTEFAVESLYILIAMNPLFQAAYFAGQTITPSWGIFLHNLWVVLLRVGSGNLFTTVSNSIGIFTFLFTFPFALFAILRRKRRKKNSH